MREYLNVPLEIKALDEATPGMFSGYGSVFNNVDSYGDVVAKGAFKDTLKEWKAKGKLPPMLLQHGGGMFGGSATDLVPIGKWLSMREDDHGLAVEGQLIAMDTERTKQVYGAMKADALDGLSIGFRTKQVKLGTKPDEPARTLQKVDLVELSVVTFPANTEAMIQDVKSDPPFTTTREFEQWVRDVTRCSKADAKEFINHVKSMLRREAAGATNEDEQRIGSALDRALAALKGASHVGGERHHHRPGQVC